MNSLELKDIMASIRLKHRKKGGRVEKETADFLHIKGTWYHNVDHTYQVDHELSHLLTDNWGKPVFAIRSQEAGLPHLYIYTEGNESAMGFDIVFETSNQYSVEYQEIIDFHVVDYMLISKAKNNQNHVKHFEQYVLETLGDSREFRLPVITGMLQFDKAYYYG